MSTALIKKIAIAKCACDPSAMGIEISESLLLDGDSLVQCKLSVQEDILSQGNEAENNEYRQLISFSGLDTLHACTLTHICTNSL